MSKIDWSKAPEWADGHGLVAHHGITEVWINMDQYAVVGAEDRAYPYGGGTGDHRHNFTRGQVQYITPRPGQWDGKGLPPVGVDCEYNDGGEWMRCEVVAHRNNAAVVLSDCYEPAFVSQQELRPIRTPGQVAAEERTKAIDELVKVTCINRGEAAKIYDAGYRKQVAP